jgi:hypothetical protein
MSRRWEIPVAGPGNSRPLRGGAALGCIQGPGYRRCAFAEIGKALSEESEVERQGPVGAARGPLMPQRDLVEFGVRWIESHRS